MLRAEDFAVNQDIAEARTLPVRAFRDADVLAHELQTVFCNNWLCLPKQHLRQTSLGADLNALSALSLRGNAVRWNFMGEDVFFKRGFSPKGNPELFLFPNRCPHAFYPLLNQAADLSRSRHIQCGQHGLSLDGDGRFLAHPGFLDTDAEAAKSLCLKPYGLAEWQELFFVHRGESRASFSDLIMPIVADTPGVPWSSLVYQGLGAGETRIVPGNWKQHAWNYMDSLHVAWIHKRPDGLQDAVDMSSYQTELHERLSLQWAYARHAVDGLPQSWLSQRFHDPKAPERQVFALWWLVFPNLTLNLYPWGLSINIYEPVTADSTRFTWQHYVLDQKKYQDRDRIWLSEQVDAEDVAAMDAVHHVLKGATRPHQRGVFSARSERGPHWFHRAVYRDMFAGQGGV